MINSTQFGIGKNSLANAVGLITKSLTELHCSFHDMTIAKGGNTIHFFGAERWLNFYLSQNFEWQRNYQIFSANRMNISIFFEPYFRAISSMTDFTNCSPVQDFI